jgi:hypothetical protein
MQRDGDQSARHLADRMPWNWHSRAELPAAAQVEYSEVEIEGLVERKAAGVG